MSVSAGRRAASLTTPGSGPRRWLAHEERWLLGVLLAVAWLLCYGVLARPGIVTGGLLLLPLMAGSLLLPPRQIPVLVAGIVAGLVLITLVEIPNVPPRRWSNGGAVLLMSALTLLLARRRSILGVAGLRGESMLVDLRERLARQGEMPALPSGWNVDVAAASADGASFAGDFMVTRLSDDGTHLYVALVDVSGKGVDAGTRSLLLSGAFGGLLGALPPHEFLPAANHFMIHQDWPEGFATAVHLSLNLRTGAGEIRYAGHPPAVQLATSRGRWVVLDDAEGPVLGLMEWPQFGCHRVVLAPGDALMLFTDGLVERSDRDLSLGIDRLLGEAERLVQRGFQAPAQTLVGRLANREDDCAMVVLQRAPQSG